MKKSIAMANVADLLRAPTEQYPDDVAIVDGERELTWTQLSSLVSAAGHGLAALGMFGGHRVALALGNSIEFVTSYLAVLRAGMVAVPLNPTLTPNELGRVLDDCGARAVIADGQILDSVRHVVVELAAGGSGPPIVVTVGADAFEGERSFSALLGTSGPEVSTPPDPEGLAVLLYTSGTSGRPRAAMLSHRALLANVEQASGIDPPPVEHTDLVLGVLPMFHVYGLNAVLGQSLHAGATLVLGRRFDPDETLDLIQHRRVTRVPVAPPVILAWSRRTDLAERLSGVRTLLSGAAPLDSAVVERFEAASGLPVEQGYGLTEAAPVVTFTLGTPEHKPGSAGRPIPGVEVRVVDELGQDNEPGDPGEIWVRGDNLFSGYWPDRDGGPDADGWLATGDIGYLDPDGDLFLVDRLKELVIVSGFNVYPTEIEDVIVEVDGVRECAVIGAPADPGGEQVVAIVVPSDPDADEDELVARINAHTTEQLARFKQPAKIEIASELPHSATGKVAKGRLRAAQARRAMGLA